MRARRYTLPRHVVRAVRPSPGRARPAEPGLWLPVPDLDALPELDELLREDHLVDSGQTLAITASVERELEKPAVSSAAVTLIDPDALVERAVGPLPAAALSAPAVAPLWEPVDFPLEVPGFAEEIPTFERATRSGLSRSRAAAVAVRRRIQVRHGARLLGALAMLAVAALVLLPRLFSAPGATVRVLVDGKSVSLRTHAATVDELLRSEGVRVGRFDRVVPPLSSAIQPDAKIRVTRAVPLSVEVDGVTTSVVTASTTTRELRAELGLAPALVARTDLVQRGGTVAFRTPHPVTLTVDGSTASIDTSARTVDELLSDQQVVLGADDLVTPSRDTLVAESPPVTIVRVAGQYESKRVEIAVPTQYRKDPSLPIGQSKVLQPGVPGEREITYKVTTHDGDAVAREQVSAVTLRGPQPKVIATGSKAPTAPKPSPRTSGGAVAPAPGSVTSATSHLETGKASWYDYTSGTCAHKTIPKGTIVKVTNTATGLWTTCRVADRGPFGAGRILDLSRDVFAQLAPSSSGVIPVKAEW